MSPLPRADPPPSSAAARAPTRRPRSRSRWVVRPPGSRPSAWCAGACCSTAAASPSARPRWRRPAGGRRRTGMGGRPRRRSSRRPSARPARAESKKGAEGGGIKVDRNACNFVAGARRTVQFLPMETSLIEVPFVDESLMRHVGSSGVGGKIAAWFAEMCGSAMTRDTPPRASRPIV